MMPPNPAARLSRALAELRWSGRTLAGRLARDKTQVRRWLSGAYEPPEVVLAWLEDLARYHASHPAPGRE